MNGFFRCSVVCALVCGLAVPAGRLHAGEADREKPRPGAGEESAPWALESLQLETGVVYRGFTQSESPHEIEFVEIHRPPAKRMYGLVRLIDPRAIAKRVPLSEADRARLLEQFAAFRHRSRIEAGRMESIALRPATGLGGRGVVYAGEWFLLESNAEEEMTRRCVVRAEQVFCAYRQVLPPPRPDSLPTLEIRLFGALDEYRAALAAENLRVENPAVYIPGPNRILAGSDLNAYARRLALVRAQNATARRQYSQLHADFPARMAALSDDLRRRGYAEDEITQEIKLRTASWKREYDSALARLHRAELQNAAKFAEVTAQMFQRLNHEAFHAYLENYVFPRDKYSVPRWLNEGWAQIFESGQLDGDTLRVDAPDIGRLRRLQADLASGQPLPLAELLAADEQAFFAAHSGRQADRYYLYSWGLAWWLTFQENLLAGEAFSRYVENKDGHGPAAAFTRLINRPLPEFEAAWRSAMMELKPGQ